MKKNTFLYYVCCVGLACLLVTALPVLAQEDDTEITVDTETETDIELETEEGSEEEIEEGAEEESEEGTEESSETEEGSEEEAEEGVEEEAEEGTEESSETEEGSEEEGIGSDDESATDVSGAVFTPAAAGKIIQKTSAGKVKNGTGGGSRDGFCGGNLNVQCSAPLQCKRESSKPNAVGVCVHPLFQKEKNIYIEVLWGNLTGKAGAETQFNGSITVNNSEIKLARPEFLETEQDNITLQNATKVVISAKTGAYQDGVILVLPYSAQNKATLDIKLNENTLKVNVKDVLTAKKQVSLKETGFELVVQVFNDAQEVNRILSSTSFDKLKKKLSDRAHESCLQDIIQNIDETTFTALLSFFDQNMSVVNSLCEQSTQLSESFFSNFGKMAKRLGNAKSSQLKNVMQNRAKLASAIARLEEKMSQSGITNQVLRDAVKKLKKQNLNDTQLQVIINAITNIQAKISQSNASRLGAEFSAQVEAAITATKQDKLTAGVLRFKDVDDDDDSWYYEFVEDSAERGIVRGYFDANGKSLNEFRPGNNVTNSEVLKMALVAVYGDIAEGQPKEAAVKAHWAAKFWYAIEDLNIAFNQYATQPDATAKRGDIVRLIVQLFQITPPRAQAACFQDVALTDNRAAAICYAKTLGIIAGDSGSENADGLAKFRPNAAINRAEVSKIISKVVSLMLESQVSVQATAQ